MKVTGASQNPAKQFEEAIRGNLDVTNAARNQYLESARGHYLSALAGLNAGKQEQTRICHSFDASVLSEDNAFNQVVEAERALTQGQQGQENTFTEMGVQIQLPNGVFSASEKSLQTVKLQLNKTLARNSRAQISEMVDALGTFRKEMDSFHAPEPKTTRTVPSVLGDAKESLQKVVAESSSLQRMVESLKAELENLKKEHAELKDVDAGEEFAARNPHFKLFKSKPENEGCPVKEAKARCTFEEVVEDKHEVEDLDNKDKSLKRENDVLKIAMEVEKKPRVARDVDETKESTVNSLDQAKSLPEGVYPACVSTSESSARLMIFEDELESSSQKTAKSAKLERGAFAAMTNGVEADKCDYTSEFSIRDYVFAARNRDISLNWPFSQKNLQLCLKHGVKDVLPPFQPMDSLRDNSMKRCLDEKSLHSLESNLNERPSMLQNHVLGTTIDHHWNQKLAEGYRDSNSFPSGGEGDLAFKTIATANSQSEVESVSTSNLPLSELSDEREAAASAANDKTKSSGSHLSTKKCKVAVKIRINNNNCAPEDITSACTAPSEAMSSKICPVCQNFSSSSNTTLNAHIDQCLYSQSPPNWMKRSRLIKPRIKQRKMRLMTDIYATALSCTLEDLDRRNGTNWAINVDFLSEDTEEPAEGKNLGVSSRYVINNGDDGSVYIDSSGRKIRILSKFNDTMPSSFSKARDNLRPKKQSRKGKRSKFFSPNRKRHLAKHLKYLKVTHQRKRFSSVKIKGRSNEACGAEEAICTVGERIVEQRPASFAKGPKAQEQKNVSVSGTSSRWISPKKSNSSKKNDSEAKARLCRYEMRAAKHALGGSDQAVTGRKLVKKHSSLPKKSLSSLQNGLRTPAFYSTRVDKSEGSSREKTLGSPSLRDSVQGNKEIFPVPLKLGAAQFNRERTKSCVRKSLASTTTPASSFEREVEVQPEAGQNADVSFPRKLLPCCHVHPSEGMKSRNSKNKMPSPSLSCVRVCISNSKQKGSALENSCGCSGDEEAEAWSADTSQHSGAMPDHPKSSAITDSFGSNSMIEVQQKQAMEHAQDGSRDTNRCGELADENQGNYGCVRFTITGLHNDREFTAPVSSSSLATGETVISLSTSLDPELKKVADLCDPLSKSLRCPDEFQGPLFRAEARVDRNQPGLSDEHEMFYGNVAAAERLELKTGDSILNFGHGSSFPEVDPVPIPGPPGSDLPSFSDMGSEDLHKSSSSSSSLSQSSGDGDDVVDGDLSDSPLSAASTISNLGITNDLTVNEQESPSAASLPAFNNIYPVWLGAGSGPFPGISAVSSQVTAAESERVTSLVDSSKEGMIAHGRTPQALNSDSQQCCCSRKEGIPWSSATALNFPESQHAGPITTTSVTSPGGNQMDSTLNNLPNSLNSRSAVFSLSRAPRAESDIATHSVETVHQSRPGECDSVSPSAPILRLMGKDLMVINREEGDPSRAQTAQNVSMNRQVHPVTEISSRVEGSWELHSPKNSTYMGPLLHELDPHILPVQHFDVGSSNMMNSNSRSPNQPSGTTGMFINKHLHARFSVHGAAPLQSFMAGWKNHYQQNPNLEVEDAQYSKKQQKKKSETLFCAFYQPMH